MFTCEVNNEFAFEFDGFYPIHFYNVKKNGVLHYQSEVYVGHTTYDAAIEFMESTFPNENFDILIEFA